MVWIIFRPYERQPPLETLQLLSQLLKYSLLRLRWFTCRRTRCSFLVEMADSEVDKRKSRPPTQLNAKDVRRERALCLKRSCAGHLSSLTKAQKEIKALLLVENPPSITLVKEKFDQYKAPWKNFVVSHHKFIDVADPKEKAQSSERFHILAQQRIDLSATVEKFICNAATQLNERVMQDLQKITMPGCRESGRSRGYRSSRYSNGLSSSKVQARRLEAEKARLALLFAEQEKKRKVEAEMKMLELERKQREF